MTILSPQKNVSLRNFLFVFFTILFLGGGFYIFQYNAFVNDRYQIEALKTVITKQEITNVDLKESLYRSIDPVRLETLAVERGLLLERQPEYLKTN